MNRPKIGIACYTLAAAISASSSLIVDSKKARSTELGVDSISEIEGQGETERELLKLKRFMQENGIKITLDKAIQRGIEKNPRLEETFDSIQQFEWQLIAAKRRWYPNLSLSNGTPFTGYQWGTFVQNEYGMRGKNREDQILREPLFVSNRSQSFVVQPGATISWNFIEPTRSPDIQAASESLQQQKFLFAVSARNLILEIQRSYYRAQRSQQLIASFEEILRINHKELRSLENQLLVSKSTVLDVAQQRAQLYSQLDQLINYINEYIRETAELAALTAAPPGQLVVPSEPASLQGEWTLPLSETLQRAIHRREEIKASLAAAQSASWRGVEAMKSYLPVIGLTSNGNLNFDNGFSNVPNGSDAGDSYRWQRNWNANAGIGFTWSIFDGGIRAAESEAFDDQSSSLAAQAEQEELQAIRQVESSYSLLQTSKLGVLSSQKAYENAYLAQEVARVRHSVGLGDITTVVQTMGQLARASAQVANATLDYNNSVAELYRYSATWPKNTEKRLETRTRKLREEGQ